jgi:hypothetical protein
MMFGDDRADVSFSSSGIADFQFGNSLDEINFELFINRTLDENARAAQTDLTLIRERRANRRRSISS